MWLLGTPDVWLRYVNPVVDAMFANVRKKPLGGGDAEFRVIRAEKLFFIAHLAGEVELRTKKENSVREVLPGYFRQSPYRARSLHLVLCSTKRYRRPEGRIVQLVAEGERLFAVGVVSGELVIARQEFKWRGK